MQGQVTIYTLKGCPFCLRAKQTLKAHGLPLVEVSIDEQSDELRSWLKETTGKTSVPQIFFNEVHVGGNDSLQAAVQDEFKWSELINKLEEPFLVSVLQIPQTKSNNEDGKIQFQCTPDPKASIIEELFHSGVVQSIRPNWFSSKYDDAFSGQNFLQWYCNAKDASLDEGLKEGKELIKKKFFLPLDPNSSQDQFVNDSKVFYRLNTSTENEALNAGSTQFCEIKDPNEFSEVLRMLVLQLYDDYISPDGKFVDYEEMRNSSSFTEYVKLSKELQRVAVERLSEAERKAFFINVYNALVIHGTALAGAPTGWISRYKFYDSTKYIIGGYSFSLNDIENGILRSNKKNIITKRSPFGKTDPRRKACLSETDPRIHFALNCGAKSCPPIKTYKGERINENLNASTEAFLETDEGVKITTEEGNKVTHIELSALFKWYRSDFGDSNASLLKWIVAHLGDQDKKNLIEKALTDETFRVSFLSYNWSTNAKE